MEENLLFIALPIANEDDYDDELVYLKTIEVSNQQSEYEKLMKRLINSFEWAKVEQLILFYDPKRFSDIFKRCNKDYLTQNPSPIQLLNFFTQFTPIPLEMPQVHVNDVPFTHGIICGYINMNNNRGALVDCDALNDGQHLRATDSKGTSVTINIINCRQEDVFIWFVNNRQPTRKIDPNYKKHGINPRSFKGVVISGRSYSDGEYLEMLQWAVGENGHHRKFFIDEKKKRLVIFWNENLKEPTFHYYDVDINDNVEYSKMLKECSKSVVEQIKHVGSLKVSIEASRASVST